ncbi:4'-phosphopantetheinyl transferase family protein [Modestobacter sp. VKM Ac-2978]|uniref:4'-phosphopantetheinyl transferase family protein n=1 Tax=Modestobacter sp. VKM Ac-2978 TaxID=3004132 RepID=UPI0022AB0B65|nr:4'-phosphopantetheinyl transferase superfamily protein [Modestobacter sp. VKM Ac-2978]MCZ2849281.1 4'-phosphopantetheinyl transferase superfamily protein [Modestobacter sp. VKM Ac-2978]
MFARLRRAPARRPLVVVATPTEVLADGDAGLLGAAERQRSASLRDPADRAAYVAAHLLVRRCAAALSGRPVVDLAVQQWCADCGTAGHGRPSIAGSPDVHVSWAHSRGVVVAAASWHPVGVDVETFPPNGSVIGRFPGLTPAEQWQLRSAADPSLLALRHWVRKECLVKAGAATLDGVHRIDLSRVVERTDRAGRSVSRYRGLRLVDWCDPTRRALVAVAGAGVPAVRPSTDLAAVHRKGPVGH